MADRTLSILLVGPDVERWVSERNWEGVDVTSTASATAARAYLSGTAFDVVLLQQGGGGADGLRALRDVLGLATPIKEVQTEEDVRRWLSGHRGATSEDVVDEQREMLEDLKRELGRVAHSLNNPLSVIMGNAQLGIELAAATEVDEHVVVAMQSIYEAGEELSALFGEVAALRARIDLLLGEEGRRG